MKKLTIVRSSTSIPVPRGIAVCPVCGADIVVEHIFEWEYEGGKPVSISIECVTEPDIDSDEWSDWFKGHWSTPYIDWLPINNRVLIWVQRNYRILTDFNTAPPPGATPDPDMSSESGQ